MEERNFREIIIEYLAEKGLKFKEAGNNQFLIEVCPACGDDKFHHVYMNQENGLWDCKKCAAKGHLNQFRNYYGDTPLDLSDFTVDPAAVGNIVPGAATIKPEKTYRSMKPEEAMDAMARLWMDPENRVLKYLVEERHLKPETIKEFKIGLTQQNEITIPVFENGLLVNIRTRRDPATDKTVGDKMPKYRSQKGCKSALFNGDILQEGANQVFITEGEFDALQLVQRGMRNVVSVTGGAGYFPDEWVQKFDTVRQIFICFDTDEEGVNGARKVAEKLGKDRCKIVILPSKPGRKKTDLTEFFTTDGKTKADFIEVVKGASRADSVGEETIKHISEFNDELRDMLIKGQHLGLPSGYAQLDQHMGGLRKGRLIVLSGLTNTGKSSFAVNMCLNLAEQKVPSFFLSLEMPPIDIAKKVLMLKGKLTGTELKKVPDPSATLTRVDQALMAFKGFSTDDRLPIFLYAGSGVVKFEILDQTAREAKDKYGVQVIFVDHLHYFAHNYNNLAAETSQAVRRIKQLAMELDITIVLLAHLNRGGRSKQRKGMYIPSLADLKETSTIEQDADQVIFVCRDSESDDRVEREKAIIKIAKNRDGAAGRSVSMTFSEEINTFVEIVGEDYEAEVKKEAAEMNAEVQTENIPF